MIPQVRSHIVAQSVAANSDKKQSSINMCAHIKASDSLLILTFSIVNSIQSSFCFFFSRISSVYLFQFNMNIIKFRWFNLIRCILETNVIFFICVANTQWIVSYSVNTSCHNINNFRIFIFICFM